MGKGRERNKDVQDAHGDRLPLGARACALTGNLTQWHFCFWDTCNPLSHTAQGPFNFKKKTRWSSPGSSVVTTSHSWKVCEGNSCSGHIPRSGVNPCSGHDGRQPINFSLSHQHFSLPLSLKTIKKFIGWELEKKLLHYRETLKIRWSMGSNQQFGRYESRKHPIGSHTHQRG